MKEIVTIAIFLLVVFTANAQEDSTWKPEKHITGYVNMVAEYTDIDNGRDPKPDPGIGLSEASFLASYKPLKKLEFKGTFVYTHFIKDLQELVVEAYGTYTINNAFKISAGKYLTPLSPINQYFYAPLNPSATLPMVVSHHFLLPQSVSGLQLSGEFGNDLKLGYNFSYGHYMTSDHPAYGIIGIQGREDISILSLNVPLPEKEYHLGGSFRIYGQYKDMINLGLNYFDGRKSTQSVSSITANGFENLFEIATKYSLGIDMQLRINNLKINGEYWYSSQKTTELEPQIKNIYAGYYAEVIYELGIFSPYLRFDYIDDTKNAAYMPFPTFKLYDGRINSTVFVGGIAIRPIYEIMVKLEYRNIKTISNYDIASNVPPEIQSVLPRPHVENNYNHYVFSLIYSF